MHQVWQDRISREQRHTLISLAKGVELGIVHHLPVLTTGTLTSSEVPRNDPLANLTRNHKRYCSRIEQSAVRHPLNTLEYDFNPRFQELLFRKLIKYRLEGVLGKYQTSYCGMFPRTNSTQRQRRLFPLNLRFSGIKTYAGKELKNYMRPSIDLSDPKVDRIRLRKITASSQAELTPRTSTTRSKSVTLRKLKEIRSQKYTDYLFRKSSLTNNIK